MVSLTTHASHHLVRLPWLRARPVIAVVLLVAAAAAAGVLIGRSTTTSAAPAEGLASERAVSVIDGILAAQNRADWKAARAYWAKDAVLEEPAKDTIWKGREEIVAVNQGAYSLGARMYRIGPVIQDGNMAAYVVWGTMESEGAPFGVGGLRWIDVVQFDKDYRIQHIWSGFDVGPAPTAT